MASAAGPVGDGDVEVGILKLPGEAAERPVGLKRARAAIGDGSYGGLYLHDTHGSQKLPDSNALRYIHYSEERSGRTDHLWTTKPTRPVNELVQIPVVQEKNQESYFMGRHARLPSDSYLEGRGTLPRLHFDGGKLLSDAAKASSVSDSHISETYHPDYRYRPFAHLQSSSLASRSSNSITGFRNMVHNSSGYSLGSQPFRETAHLGMTFLNQLTPGIEKVGLHKDARFDEGCGTSRPALLPSSSRQPWNLSPIKDDPWITSVPFVPLVFPGSTSPSYSKYDQLVDSMDLPKVEGINILKSSNISCSTSSQHTTGNVVIDGDANKSMNYDDKLARNMSAKGSNEFAGLVPPDTMLKASERKNDAAINEKTRDFRFHLAEHVKELLKPYWKEGDLNKDAHKLIVKKSVDKVLASVELHQVPATKELITDYIIMAETKIEKLVKAYVDKHRTK